MSADHPRQRRGRRGPARQRPEPTPTQRALSLLTRREHSRLELTRKLAARGVDPEAAQAAVDKLGAAGWQDEARFAESLERSRAAAGYGPVRIRAELGTHRLPDEVVVAAMDGFDGDWRENARDLVRRRLGEGVQDDPARRRKAADLLYRRGFGSVRVQCRIGDVIWRTSLFPQKSGGYFLPIKIDVCRKEGLAAGDQVTVDLELL